MDGPEQREKVLPVADVEIHGWDLRRILIQNSLDDRLRILVVNAVLLDLQEIPKCPVRFPSLVQVRDPLLAGREDCVAPKDLTHFAISLIFLLPAGRNDEGMAILGQISLVDDLRMDLLTSAMVLGLEECSGEGECLVILTAGSSVPSSFTL